MRILSNLLLGSIVCIGLWSSKPAQAEPIPTEFFARLPAVSDPKISPDGSKLLAQLDGAGKAQLGVINLADPLDVRFLTMGKDEFTLMDAWWANDEQVLVAVNVFFQRGGMPLNETRLILFSLKKGKIDLLGPRGSGEEFQQRVAYMPQLQHQIVHMLPDDPKSVLVQMAMKRTTRKGVYRLYFNKNRYQRVERDQPNISTWYAAPNGDLLAAERISGTEYVALGRLDDDDALQEISRYEAFSENAPSIAGYPIKAEGNPLVYLLNENGRNALYAYDFASRTVGNVLVGSDVYDLRGVITPFVGGPVIGATMIKGKIESVYVDPTWAARQARLERIFPNKTVRIHNWSVDGTKIVVSVSAPTQAPMYYLYQPTAGKVSVLMQAYAELAGQTLAEVERLDVEISEQLLIPTYVTYPVNGSRENLPTVVMPHGGPHARDYQRFDYWAQFLASRGYLVVQPNFRGSDGYGAGWREAGRGQWGGVMQKDVEQITRQLIAEGLVDGNRLCIVGGSYGGYMAMSSAASDASLYKCAASINGVSDLRALHQSKRNVVNRALNERALQGETDREKFFAQSPIRRAESVDIPVLLIHANEDRNVPVYHSRNMRDALSGAGKEVRYVELEDDDHYLQLTRSRLTTLTELEAFLDKHIGQGELTPWVQ